MRIIHTWSPYCIFLPIHIVFIWNLGYYLYTLIFDLIFIIRDHLTFYFLIVIIHWRNIYWHILSFVWSNPDIDVLLFHKCFIELFFFFYVYGLYSDLYYVSKFSCRLLRFLRLRMDINPYSTLSSVNLSIYFLALLAP